LCCTVEKDLANNIQSHHFSYDPAALNSNGKARWVAGYDWNVGRPDYVTSNTIPVTKVVSVVVLSMHVLSSEIIQLAGFKKDLSSHINSMSKLFSPFTFEEYIMSDGNLTPIQPAGAPSGGQDIPLYHADNSFDNLNLLQFKFDAFGGCLHLLRLTGIGEYSTVDNYHQLVRDTLFCFVM
jgi:hypothetical protein